MNRSSKAKRKNVSRSSGLRTSHREKGLRQQEVPVRSALILEKYLVRNNKDCVHFIRDNEDCVHIENEAVVHNLKDGQVYGLNLMANFIWKQANGRTKVKQIIEKIYKEFEVDRHTAEKDCLEFLNILISRRLVFLSQNPVRG